MDSLLSSPLSLYSIPIVWLTAVVPAALRNRAVASLKGFNNVQPRGNTSRVRNDKEVPPAVAARIERMEGAHLNGNENMPLWAVAVLAANFAGLDARTVNLVSFAYISGRILYNYLYITQTTRLQGALRSLTFFASLSLPLYLLIASAAKVAKDGQK